MTDRSPSEELGLERGRCALEPGAPRLVPWRDRVPSAALSRGLWAPSLSQGRFSLAPFLPTGPLASWVHFPPSGRLSSHSFVCLLVFEGEKDVFGSLEIFKWHILGDNSVMGWGGAARV